MKHNIISVADLGLIIRAVRKTSSIRQDDLAESAKVSKQFAVDVEHGKPTVQFDKVMALLRELGIQITVDIPVSASQELERQRQLYSARFTQMRHAKGKAPRRSADEQTNTASKDVQ